MIKAYIPNTLMRASADVIKRHPLAAQPRSLTKAELRKLLESIKSCRPDDLPVLAASLLRREVYALCEYLPHNSFKMPLLNIRNVLSLRMNPVYYRVLFREWQNFPQNGSVLKLLADHDTKENHGESIKIPVGMFDKWNKSDNLIKDVTAYATTFCRLSKFSEKFKNAGFISESPLQNVCFSSYLTSCGMNGFLEEGDISVSECVKKTTTTDAEMILLNLLISGSSYRNSLKAFNQCFEIMALKWKQPSAGYFPKNQPEALRTYTWWFNYTEMSKGFFWDTHQRRRNFWEQYLDRCSVSRFAQHQMLVFYFEKCCALEFENEGRMYIFDKQYFQNEILPEISKHPTSTLKSWLWNHSHPLYNKPHVGKWENEVAVQLRHII